MDAWQDAKHPNGAACPESAESEDTSGWPAVKRSFSQVSLGSVGGPFAFFSRLLPLLARSTLGLVGGCMSCIWQGEVVGERVVLACSPYDSLARIDETILRYSVFLVWLRHTTNIGLLCSSMPYLDLFMSSNARNKDMFRCLGVSFSGLHSSSATTSTPPQPVSRRVRTVVGQIPSDQRPVGLEARFSTSRLKPIAAPLPTSVGLQVEFRQPSEDGGHHVPFQRQSGPYARQGCQSTCAMFANLNDRQLGQVSRNLGAD